MFDRFRRNLVLAPERTLAPPDNKTISARGDAVLCQIILAICYYFPATTGLNLYLSELWKIINVFESVRAVWRCGFHSVDGFYVLRLSFLYIAIAHTCRVTRVFCSKQKLPGAVTESHLKCIPRARGE